MKFQFHFAIYRPESRPEICFVVCQTLRPPVRMPTSLPVNIELRLENTVGYCYLFEKGQYGIRVPTGVLIM